MPRKQDPNSTRSKIIALQPGESFTVENTASPLSVKSMTYAASIGNKGEKSFSFVVDKTSNELFNVTITRVR